MRSVWETLLSILLAPLLVTVLLFAGAEISGVGPTAPVSSCPQFERAYPVAKQHAAQPDDCNYVVILGSTEVTIPTGFLLIYSTDGERFRKNVPAGTTITSFEFTLKRVSQ